MAKLSMKLKQSRPAKFSTRAYTRCRICGRPHSVLRKYGVCCLIDSDSNAGRNDDGFSSNSRHCLLPLSYHT